MNTPKWFLGLLIGFLIVIAGLGVANLWAEVKSYQLWAGAINEQRTYNAAQRARRDSIRADSLNRLRDTLTRSPQ